MENETDSFNFPHLFFSTSIYSLVDDVGCSRGVRIFCEYLQRSHGYRCCDCIPHLGNQNWDWFFLRRFYSNAESCRYDGFGIFAFADTSYLGFSSNYGWAQCSKWASIENVISFTQFKSKKHVTFPKVYCITYSFSGPLIHKKL